MAKQSGLHQLKGKIGEFSYYKQSGVSGGLVRSINPAMSTRVKTSQEYANTRLNNAEFGQACAIAGKVAEAIIPKFRPMILPFSQAKLAKLILEQIKATTGNWGQRNFVDANGDAICPILNSVAKNNMDDWGVIFDNPEEGELTITTTNPQFTQKMAEIGADGVVQQFIAANLYVGNYLSDIDKYFATAIRVDTDSTDNDAVDEWEPSTDMPADLPSAEYAHSVHFFVLVMMPYRTINGVQHILQEHCTFRAYSRTGVY